MPKSRAVSFLLVVLLLAAVVSPAPLQAATREGTAPSAQSFFQSFVSCLGVILAFADSDLAGIIVPPFETPAGIVER
jgi:hypothetical protein